MKKTTFSNTSTSTSPSISSSLSLSDGETSDIKKQTVAVYPAIETRKQTVDHWEELNKIFFSSNDILKGENSTVQTKENNNEWIPVTWKKENGKIILPPLHNDRAFFLAHQWHDYCCRCMRINFPSNTTILGPISTNIDNHNNSSDNFPHHNHQQQHPSAPLYHEASPFLCTDHTTVATITELLSPPSSHNTYPCRNFEVIDQSLPPPTVLMSSLIETSIASPLVSSKQQKRQRLNNQDTNSNNNNYDNKDGNANGIMMVDNTNNPTAPTTVMTELQEDRQRSVAKTARGCFDYTTVYRLYVLLFESALLDKLSKNVERQKVIEETGLNRSQVNNWIARHNRKLKGPIKLYRQLVREKAIEHSYKSFITYCREHRVMHELPSDDDDDDSSGNGSIQNNSNSNDMDTGDLV